MLNLTQLTKEYDTYRKQRAECGYTGLCDLKLLNKMADIRDEITLELAKVRAKIEVCPLSMLSELKQRERELVEWKRKNT